VAAHDPPVNDTNRGRALLVDVTGGTVTFPMGAESMFVLVPGGS